MATHGLKLLAYQLADNNHAISRRRMSAQEQTAYFWSPSALFSDDNVRLEPELLIAVPGAGCVVLGRGPLKGNSGLQGGFYSYRNAS